MAEVSFTIQAADIDETPPEGLPATEVPEYLSKEKAKVIAARNEGATIIAADTVVILDGKILGKPEDEADAVQILKQLSGNIHRVVSGVCIQRGDEQESFSVTTEVHFRPLTEEQIRHYVANYKPYDKAGAYAIQEWIGVIGIKQIVGDYYNVMGLPVGDVMKRLVL